jgi:hypothetical protein
VSPTAPTFVTLNGQLTKAHRRIRELEARETELVAHNRTLHAVITELTDKDACTGAELCPSPLPTPSSSDARLGVGERASQRLDPGAQSPTPAKSSAPTPASDTGRNRVRTRRSPYV